MSGDRVTQRIRTALAATGIGVQPPAGLYLAAPGGRTSTTKGANGLEVAPFECGIEQWCAGVAVSVTSVGGSIRVGIYADTGQGQPGTLMLDLGALSASTTGVKTIAAGFVLPKGLWWVGAVPQGNNAGLACYSGHLRPVAASDLAVVANPGLNGYAMSGVTGALPTTFTVTGASGTTPVVGLLTA